MIFQKQLRVDKRERYVFGVAAWLNGETLQSATVTPDTQLATLFGAHDVSGGDIGFFLDGVAPGWCKVHFEYSTATRSDCYTALVLVSTC